MILQEHFEASGEWLFRRRTYLPIFLFAVPVGFLAARPEAAARALAPAWQAVAVTIAFAGLIVRIITVGVAPRGTSGRNTERQVAAALNTTGLYSLIRHPLYAGNFLMWLGPALLPGSWEVLLIVSLAFWLYYERIMAAEEGFLKLQFGDAFVRWALHTPAFLPHVQGARENWRRSVLPFSWRVVAQREYSGLLSMVASFFVLDAVARAHGAYRWSVSSVWLVALGAAAALALSLRLLKRRSGLLTVDGR